MLEVNLRWWLPYRSEINIDTPSADLPLKQCLKDTIPYYWSANIQFAFGLENVIQSTKYGPITKTALAKFGKNVHITI
jgi:hypothetical protein